MKTLTYQIGGQTLTLTLDTERGTILEARGQDAPTDRELAELTAAAALALMEHEVEIVHDEEPGVITLKPRATAWNSPALALAVRKQ